MYRSSTALQGVALKNQTRNLLPQGDKARKTARSGFAWNIAFALCFMLTHNSFAESNEPTQEFDGVSYYYHHTPEQLRDLDAEERSSRVPIMYTSVARVGLHPDSPLFFGMQLNSLMYPGIADYQKAITAFQKDLGDTPTGTLTVGQLQKLELYSDMQKLSGVGFPDEFSSWMSDGFASIKGTYIIHDDNIWNPINHHVLTCTKSSMYCEDSELALRLPKEDGWTQTYNIYRFKPEGYRVTRWEANQIEAVPIDPGSGCRKTTLTFNFDTDEFYSITTNGTGSCKSELFDVEFDKLSKPRISQIVDGGPIIRKQFQDIKRNALEVINHKVRDRLLTIIESEEKK